MSAALPHLMHGFNVVTLVYFVVLQVTYTLLAIVGWRAIEDYVQRRPMRDYRAVANSELSMPVSILVPAYNEEATIVSSVRSLLTSQFVEFEVVVINDGSGDATMTALADAFGLVKVGRVPRSNIPTAHVRGVFASPLEPRIVVIDKANGGKADALNAGINHADYPLFCAIDADTMLDAGAPCRGWCGSSRPRRRRSPSAGSCGSSTARRSRTASVATCPHAAQRLLANLQIVEYLRAFLGGRIGWSSAGCC